jgi:ATP-dependent protease ClpP protease subunit
MEVIEEDIARPKYFTPYTAVEYGLIDKVLEADANKMSKTIAKAANLGR